MNDKGFYYQFARLAIRLLAELCFQSYKSQGMPEKLIREVPVVAEALAWLEKTK